MSELTPRLALPLIAAGQSQKHVPVNEALGWLDALVQISVLGRSSQSPPDFPAAGARYLVAEGASGAWTGHENTIAAYDAGWTFIEPDEGWFVWDAAGKEFVVFTAGGWEVFSAGGDIQGAPLFGLGAEADADNPFVAKLNTALWTARESGEGGTGDLRYVMNKQAGGDVLSLLLQSGYSGRAEIGLVGDEDLLIKVSGDGGTWLEALRIDRLTGRASFPQGGVRAKLNANRTYYVRHDLGGCTISGGSPGVVTKSAHGLLDGQAVIFSTSGALPAGALAGAIYYVANASLDTFQISSTPGGAPINLSGTGGGFHTAATGSDTASGLSNAPSEALLTLQKAWDLMADLDMATFSGTIQAADSTYLTGIAFDKAPVGGAGVTLLGNTTTPGSCRVSTTGSALLVTAPLPQLLSIRGFKASATAGDLIRADAACVIQHDSMIFGSAPGRSHIRASTPGIYIEAKGSYAIDGGAAFHWFVGPGSYFRDTSASTATLNGTPHFTSAFAHANMGGSMLVTTSVTFSGTATGKRFDVVTNGIISTAGAAGTFLPGNAAGSVATQGQYL